MPYQRYKTKSKALETTDGGGAAVVICGSSKSAMFFRKTKFVVA